MTDDADLQHFVHRIGATLDAVGVEWMLVGSVASSLNGAPRATQDVDFVVRMGLGSIRRLLNLLPDDQYYVDESAIREAIQLRRSFNIIDLRSAWKADLILPARTAFAESEFARRVSIQLGERAAWVASAEDTILAKLVWAAKSGGSERQHRDVTGVLLARKDLDFAYLDRWAAELCVHDTWRALRPR